jgi:hypothetical protein
MGSNKIKTNLKITIKRKKKIGKIFETMKGFSYVIFVTSHNIIKTVEGDDYDQDD